jgi:hypothetical protein
VNKIVFFIAKGDDENDKENKRTISSTKELH